MDISKKKDFLVDKNNLFKTGFGESTISKLQEGEVLLKIDKYAFTSNNITYAVVGHKIKYWDFFPAEAPNGIVPVWGFADVVESRQEGVKKGERFYGYFPMSNFLKVKAGKVKPHGFSDVSQHREHLAAVYNYYRNTANDPGYQKDQEDFQPILRPLFATSFLIYYFLKDKTFFDAENITLTSASSKTALGLAFLLKKYKQGDGKNIIGLTSGRNVDFVKNSGFYDEVIPYDNALANLTKTDSVVIDFAGNSSLLQNIYHKLEEQLKHVALIGLTDWKSQKEFKEIPIAKFFFAPTHFQNKYQEWGAEKTNKMLGEELSGFASVLAKWMEITYIKNDQALSDLYLDMLQGNVDPSKGYIVTV